MKESQKTGWFSWLFELSDPKPDSQIKARLKMDFSFFRLQNPNVVRDTCRTLAVIGDKSVIPSIEPLMASPNSKIKQDAWDTIGILKSKP
jgi:hypothetical protein